MTSVDDAGFDWDELDPLIVAGRKLEFVARVRTSAKLSFVEAHDILVARYDHLRRTRPDAFSCSHEEYWREFFS